MIFGALIDSTCRLWQADVSACQRGGSRGSCLWFDTDQLRLRTYGVVLGIQLLQFIFLVLLYCAIRHRRFDNKELRSSQVSARSPRLSIDGDGGPHPTHGEHDLVEIAEDK